MVNNADFIVEVIFMLINNVKDNILVHTIYQPTIKHQSSMFFVGFKSYVHLKKFQLRGWRWVYHVGMSSVSTVAHYLYM